MHLKYYCLIISFTGISPKQHIRIEEIQIHKSAHHNILHAKSLQLCPTLCDLMDCNFSAHGILQSKILGGLPCSPPGDLPNLNPGIEPTSVMSPALAGGFFTTIATCEALHNIISLFSRSVVSDSLQPHESQHTRPTCPSPTPGVHANSRPLSQ